MMNRKREVIARIARQCLVLATFLAMALSAANISRAQSSATSAATSAVRMAPAPDEKPTPSAAKGQHEGITVHGHWTIEVRNPDGKLVTHREFENSLVTTGSTNGASLLAGLLSGVVTPGTWLVALSADAGDGIVIFESASPAASASCTTLQQTHFNIICSGNLSVNGPQLGAGGISSGALVGNTLTLSGSGVVPSGGFPAPINNVSTASSVCAASVSPTACGTSSSGTLLASLTSRSLDGLNGDPSAVPVAAGQTVAVTVIISFQ